MPRSKGNWWSTAVQDNAILIVLAMMVVVPFIATPLDSRSTGSAAFVCEMFGIALLVSLMWKRRPQITMETVGTFLKTGANVPALIYLVLIGVSLARSPHFYFSAQEALRLGTGILVYFVVAYQFRRSEHITKLVDLIVLIAIGASFVSFAQYGASPSSTGYATGLFSDHQMLGSFLMLLLPFVCMAALSEQPSNRQLLAQIATVMTLVALLISEARSAWVGTAIGVAVLGLVTLWSASQRHHVARRKYEIVLPIMLLVVSVGFFLLVSPETGSIGDRMRTTLNPAGESAVEYRSHLAQGAIAMIKDRPLTGQGIGLYPMYQQQFTGSGMKVWLLHDKHGNFARPGMGEMAHNLYLQTAAELGIPGLVVFAAIPLVFVLMALSRIRTMDAGVRRNVLVAATASIIAFMVDALASPSWQYGQVSMFMWIVLGMGVGSLRPRHRRYSSSRETEDTERQLRPSAGRSVLRGAAVVAGLGLAFVTLQSVVYAGPGGYVTPKKADLEPKGATIYSYEAQSYTLTVTFSDNSIYDVTTDPATVFSLTTSAFGTLNANTYTASGAAETVGIKGLYTFNQVTVFDTTNLFVQKGD
jgi:putative inorganic carbon (HCO3(-)) transporter